MVITSKDMIVQSLLSNSTDYGNIENEERPRDFIVKTIEGYGEKMAEDPVRTNFLYSFNDNQYQEILTYNNITKPIDKYYDDPDVWTFKRITAHEGPLLQHHHTYK